jgi:hypothetical protein
MLPYPNSSAEVAAGTNLPLTDHLYFDRCIIGQDSEDLANFSTCAHGFLGGVDHFTMHQCHIWGLVSWTQYDDYLLGCGAGSNHVFRNIYLEAASEGVIYGGLFIPEAHHPSDITLEYSFGAKLTGWQRNRFWDNATNTMYAYTHGNKVKNQWELKCGIRVLLHDNLFFGGWHNLNPSGAQQGVVAGGGVRGNSGGRYDTTNPWNRITDFDIRNNQGWHVGKNTGFFGPCSGDGEPTTAITRVRVRNNVYLMNPGAVIGGTVGPVHMADDPWPIPAYIAQTEGPLADIEFRHNTMIINNASPNLLQSGLITGPNGVGPNYVFFLYTVYSNGPLADLSGDPRNNRWLIADNILDCRANGPNARTFNSDGPLIPQGAAMTMIPIFTDCLITANLVPQDTTVYQQTVATDWFHPAVGTTIPYSAFGFANFIDNTLIPWPMNGWNVTTGTYATAATDGTSLGATQ